MQVNNDGVGVEAGRLDCGDEASQVVVLRRRETALSVGCRPRGDVLTVKHVSGAKDRDALALHIYSIRSVSLGGVISDSEHRKLLLGASGD